MHHHCEIIMPRTKDIGEAIKEIMKPFDENKENEEYASGSSFWDFYVIGGRWAGIKETCGYGEEKMTEFYAALKDNKITVSGFQSGKQTISPASQIPLVDKLWNDFFPTENGEITPCPMFDHSNNQYDSDDLLSCDICLVEEIPKNLTCSRVIIAGQNYNDTGLEATFMLCDSQWNGVNHMPINWGKNVKTAIEMFEKQLANYKEEYRDKVTPKPDWLCITIDYHS